MKKLLTLTIIGLLMFSCKQEEKQTEYVINGTAKGVYNGIRVYLKTLDVKSFKEKVIDTAIVMNEKFSFTGNLDNPDFRVISVDNIVGRLPFILENTIFNIDINKDNITASAISGSETHSTFKTYESELEVLKRKNDEVSQLYRNAARLKNNSMIDSLSIVLRDLRNEMAEFPLRFIEKNNDSQLSLILIDQEIDKGVFSVETYKDAFDLLEDEIKNSNKGKLIRTKINALYQKATGKNNLEIGKIAPNFEAPIPDGKIISLNDVKGKVTIIDFWASWCGPCRKENPKVVKIYEEYHKEGLEIIGVSLDGQSRQSDPKKSWLEAIEKDRLTWHHVSNLNYFNDPVAQLYNIQSIPATYILDAEGKIVAKNLRGQALELKVKELLNN